MSSQPALPSAPSAEVAHRDAGGDVPQPPTLAAPTVLVYSDDPDIRLRVRQAVGTRPDPDLGVVDWVEVADGRACVAAVDAGGIDVAVLDGEAWPTGGMGIARQLRDEIPDSPGTILLVARADDRWLATWSRADAVLPHPVDPFALTDAVLRLLRERAARAAHAPAPLTPAERLRGFGLRRG